MLIGLALGDCFGLELATRLDGKCRGVFLTLLELDVRHSGTCKFLGHTNVGRTESSTPPPALTSVVPA